MSPDNRRHFSVEDSPTADEKLGVLQEGVASFYPGQFPDLDQAIADAGSNISIATQGVVWTPKDV